MSEHPHVPGPEDPTPADVPRGEADVPPTLPDEREDRTDPAPGPRGA